MLLILETLFVCITLFNVTVLSFFLRLVLANAKEYFMAYAVSLHATSKIL